MVKYLHTVWTFSVFLLLMGKSTYEQFWHFSRFSIDGESSYILQVWEFSVDSVIMEKYLYTV